jgi:hypothetical protein
MKRVKVRTEWMGLHPRNDMRFWLAVALRVKTRSVRHKDFHTIKLICMEVDHQIKQLKGDQV